MACARKSTKLRYWTAEEEALLRQLYPDCETPDLAKAFDTIYSKAYQIGLKKSADWNIKHPGFKNADGSHTGKNFQFKPGQPPHNKGIPFNAGGHSAETQFKKGNKPHSWKPVGHLRETSGYLMLKISDTGNSKQDYVELHRLEWEKHHGPIPPGMCVIFKDGNKRNFAIENLELKTRQEIMAQNTFIQWPMELQRTMRLSKKIRRAIQERANP